MVSRSQAARYPDPLLTSQVVTVTATVTVDGASPSAGDVVAAYSVHPVPGSPGTWERTVVGHHVMGVGEQTIAVPVYGDDPLFAGAANR